MHRRGNDVLISDTDISAHTSRFILRTDGALVGGRDGGDDNRAPVDMIGIKLDAGLRLAVFIGRLVHHEDLLLAAHTRQMAVVADANQQPSSVRIGKGRHRLGQLTGIGHAIFEVLLLVFALTDKAEKIPLVVHVIHFIPLNMNSVYLISKFTEFSE